MTNIKENEEEKAPPGFVNPRSGSFNYYEYKELKFSCKKCGWFGSGSKLQIGEVFDTLEELECPNCSTYISCVAFPTLQENLENWDKLSDDERVMHELISEKQSDFLDRCLKSADQLPEIPGRQKFTPVWSNDGGDTVVTHGDLELFREPTIYEGFERFKEIALILKERYKDRIRGLHPMGSSELNLYGDKLGARDNLKAFQCEIFGEPAKVERIFVKKSECIGSVYFELQPGPDAGEHWLAESIYSHEERWTDFIEPLVKFCLPSYDRHGTCTHGKKEWQSLGMFCSSLQSRLSEINAAAGISVAMPEWSEYMCEQLMEDFPESVRSIEADMKFVSDWIDAVLLEQDFITLRGI